MAVDSGIGASIAFGTSTFTAEVLGITLSGLSRPVIDKTHLGTTLARDFTPGALPDYGGIDVKVHLDPVKIEELEALLIAAAEIITITFPKTLTTAATIVGTGFVHAVDFDEINSADDAMMTATLSIKWSDAADIPDFVKEA